MGPLRIVKGTGCPVNPVAVSVNAHDALRALLQRYARAADERDIDALAGLFHPEAEIAGARGAQTAGRVARDHACARARSRRACT